MNDNKSARLRAYVTGLVNQKLLLQNEYLVAENRILRAHLLDLFRLTKAISIAIIMLRRLETPRTIASA
jgi:hypothetical protein